MAVTRTVDKAGAFADYRLDFPALNRSWRSLAYLDSAASAQKPQAVIDAMSGLMASHYANIHRGLYEYSQETTSAFELARKKIASFVGVKNSDEIIFTGNATGAINLVAQSWGRANLKEGDEIILTGMEHHANIVPWQLLRDQIGIVIKTVPVNEDGQLDLDAFKTLLTPRTKLVGVTHVSNALGTVNNLKEIKSLISKVNSEIKLIVDGSQAVVHRPVNIEDIDCDFYVFTGHKLYGPTGIGVLWGRYELLERMPPYQGGGDMVERVTFEKTTFKPPPARFEAGTPAIIEAVGLGAAVDYISSIGMEAIEAREQELLSYAMEQLKQIEGLRYFGAAPEKAGIISFAADWGHPGDIGMILDQCGVAVRTGHHCCQPLMQRYDIDATVRASFGLYTNEEDIDMLVKGLQKARDMLR